MTVPSGHGVSTDRFKTPQFYRNLGELRPGEQRTVDFGLLRTPESANPNFSFANLADVHIRGADAQSGGNNYTTRFTGQLAQVNALTGDPAFVQISGDLTDFASDTEFEAYKAATATSKLPVWPAMGNHEYVPGAPDYRSRINNYRRHLGPEWYSFDYGNRHFVVLENNSSNWGDADQLEWLRQDLTVNGQGKEVVTIVHKPLNTPQTPSGTKPFIDLLGTSNTALVLMGHTHVNDVDFSTVPKAKHVVTNSSSYTIDQTPNGFRHVRFHGGREAHPFKMYDVNRSLTLTSPAPASAAEQGRVQIQANAYHTSSDVTEVEYRIDGGPWHKLAPSSHFTWAGEWDARRASIGEHRIELKATDDGRQSWTRSGSFRLVAPGSLARPRAGAAWPMFHGNAQHTGEASEVVTPPLRLAWSHRSPGTILASSPAVVDGVAYVGIRDENGEDHNLVVAVDVASGQQRWAFRADAQVQASPAVAEGIVYATSVRGTLYALDARTGHKLWDKSVGASDDGVHRGWMYYSPTVADGVVYQAYSTGSTGFLMALNARTGAQTWNSRLAGSWISERSPVVKDGRVHVGGDFGTIVTLNAATGAELWRKEPAGGWAHSMPAVADGRLYVGFDGGLLVALDAATGTEVWRYSSPDQSYIAGKTTGSSPAVAGGVVYMGFPDGNVAALEAATGRRLWSSRTGGGIISSPAVSGNTVYIGSNDGRLYAFNKQTGEKVWSFEIGTWVASSPAISGNTLLVGAWDGNLYAFTEQR